MSLINLVPYKNYGIAILIGIYSLGVWHISARYTSDVWQQEKTTLVQKALESTQQRQELAYQIGKQVEDAVGKIKITQQTIQQKVIHETTTQPVYINCATTPDGVHLIESAIDNQGSPTQ